MISNGIDIVKIDRFKDLKNNKNLFHKIFNDIELEYINKRKFNVSTISGMYAAKEAFLKSLKKGINDYDLLDVIILHNDNNAPYIKLKGKLSEDYRPKNISLSISHDGEYAVSVVSIIF